MNQALAAVPDTGSIIEEVVAKGDLSKLTPEQRAFFYTEVCRSVGLNPLTKPFEYLTLNNKLILYANKGCTDQLRGLHHINIRITNQQVTNDAYVVTVEGTTNKGRGDTEIGAVSIKGLTGDAYCNAIMKATTKAKRRLTLSMCGLGMLDESEIETIPADRRGPEPRVIHPAPKRATQADVVAKVAAGTPQDIGQPGTVDTETGEIVPALPTFEPPTDKQKKMLWALARRAWQDEDDAKLALLTLADHLFGGVVSLGQLTKAQASALIDRVNTQSEEQLVAMRWEVAELVEARQQHGDADEYPEGPS